MRTAIFDKTRQIFKDYGPAIGPAFAFLLSILAFFANRQFQRISARWDTMKQLNELQVQIMQSPPPPYFYPNVTKSGVSADELRNIANTARFYNRLLATKSILATTELDIKTAGDLSQTQRFYHIKFLFDILFEDVERIRKGKKVDYQEFQGIVSTYKSLKEACTEPKPDIEYVQPAP